MTARFALKPVLESIARAREAQSGSNGRELAALEQRVALLERQCQNLEGSFERITEAKDFEQRLNLPRTAD